MGKVGDLRNREVARKEKVGDQEIMERRERGGEGDWNPEESLGKGPSDTPSETLGDDDDDDKFM